MAADQRNSQLFTYVDENGVSWNKRGPINAAINAVDGSSAFNAANPLWTDSKARRCRKAVFQDPTTFRTVRFPVFTHAAYAALTSASTIALHVEGETATVTYQLADTIPERVRKVKASRNLVDHA